jgi:hypothetical protein
LRIARLAGSRGGTTDALRPHRMRNIKLFALAHLALIAIALFG